MTLDTEKPDHPANRCWKDCISITLREATTALEESFGDLTNEQLWQRPLPERHSIGSVVMHCLANVNEYGCDVQTGDGVQCLAEEKWFDMWSWGPEDLDGFQKGRQLPDAAQMVQWLRQVREKALGGLEEATEEDLRGLRVGSDWCVRTGRMAGDAYPRTVFHTMAHVRQVWCLRGVMGAFGQGAWPVQHIA